MEDLDCKILENGIENNPETGEILVRKTTETQKNVIKDHKKKPDA
jgi:hypothetical protein